MHDSEYQTPKKQEKLTRVVELVINTMYISVKAYSTLSYSIEIPASVGVQEETKVKLKVLIFIS